MMRPGPALEIVDMVIGMSNCNACTWGVAKNCKTNCQLHCAIIKIDNLKINNSNIDNSKIDDFAVIDNQLIFDNSNPQ